MSDQSMYLQPELQRSINFWLYSFDSVSIATILAEKNMLGNMHHPPPSKEYKPYFEMLKVKVSHNLLAVGAVMVRGPLYLWHTI